MGFVPQPWGSGRGSRIKLNIQADSPLLVLPMSSYSTKVLMADLGFLEVSNCFKFAGDQGTISASKLSTLKTGELGGEGPGQPAAPGHLRDQDPRPGRQTDGPPGQGEG